LSLFSNTYKDGSHAAVQRVLSSSLQVKQIRSEYYDRAAILYREFSSKSTPLSRESDLLGPQTVGKIT